MPISWSEALKRHNAGKKWSVPRKGTPDYDAVKKLMSDGAPSSTPAAPKEKKPRKPRAKKETAAPTPADAAPEKKKRGRPVKTKPTLKDEGIRHKNDPIKTTPKLDTPNLPKEGVVKDPDTLPAPPPPKKKRVGKSGKPGNAEISQSQINDRIGLGSKIPQADVASLKKNIEKALSDKSNPIPQKDESEKDATVDNLKSNDQPALETLAPFSFNALRNKLRC